MTMHESTFRYLKPTDQQMQAMEIVRQWYFDMGEQLQQTLPDGADKTHVFRLLRTAAMWSNIAITREQDGSPRGDT
jgi:hypothetical protein